MISASVRRDRARMLVLDPPVPIDIEAIGLQAIGVKMFERNGVYHILDWVGENHYPNVADFVEEALAVGVSRRMPSNLDYSRITPDSRLLLVHKKAFLDGRSDLQNSTPACPSITPSHDGTIDGMVPMCVRHWWNDLEGGTLVTEGGREVARALQCGASYTGWRRANRSLYPVRMPAIFASVKLSRLALVRDTAGGDRDTAARLRAAGVAYTRVEG